MKSTLAEFETVVETDVATEDSELPDSDPGDPARGTLARFLGRPFNLGARNLIMCNLSSNRSNPGGHHLNILKVRQRFSCFLPK